MSLPVPNFMLSEVISLSNPTKYLYSMWCSVDGSAHIFKRNIFGLSWTTAHEKSSSSGNFLGKSLLLQFLIL